MAQPRLNRKRYRECVIALKAIVSDAKAPQQRRLRAVELLLGIYDKSDRSHQRREALQRAVEAPEAPSINDDGADLEAALEQLRNARDEQEVAA